MGRRQLTILVFPLTLFDDLSLPAENAELCEAINLKRQFKLVVNYNDAYNIENADSKRRAAKTRVRIVHRCGRWRSAGARLKAAATSLALAFAAVAAAAAAEMRAIARLVVGQNDCASARARLARSIDRRRFATMQRRRRQNA